MSDHGLRELFLIRHAKTDRHESEEADEQHLSAKGKKQACKLGDWLKQKNITFDAVYLSPDTRASQTARRLKLDGLTLHKETVPALENATLQTLVAVLEKVPTDLNKVCIIGHEPGLKDLIQYLNEDGNCEHCDASLFPAGALAHFIMPHDWLDLSQGSGKLMQLIRPKDI